MRGAVLYRLGVDLVKERVMRASYGTTMDPLFRSRYHPEDRRFKDCDGKERCASVMCWFANKARSFPSLV